MTVANLQEERGGAEWSISSVLRWSTADFRRRGFENARLDAELLLAFSLGTDRIRLIIESERVLTSQELSSYRELIKRRRAGEPIAYIVHEREFFGFLLRVDKRVLIPRPDTETLVHVALARTERRSMFGHALDLCTGSGCVAIAFAKARPTWRVTGIDVSSDALHVARENAMRLGAIWGVHFAVGNLLEGLLSHTPFDLITANPPYIPSADVETLETAIRSFEPRLALDGGTDGLAVTSVIIRDAERMLAPDGVLAIEVSYDQADRVASLAERAGFTDIQRSRDYGGHERVVSAKAPEHAGSCRG